MQPYESHVMGVLKKALAYVADICRYSSNDSEIMSHVVRQAVIFHDLGKLEKTNQPILLGEESGKKLPINHVDAGAAYFLANDNFSSQITAAVIQAHHIGFCDFIEEEKKEDYVFRDLSILEHTNNELGRVHTTQTYQNND
jgi:hypothetical protein